MVLFLNLLVNLPKSIFLAFQLDNDSVFGPTPPKSPDQSPSVSSPAPRELNLPIRKSEKASPEIEKVSKQERTSEGKNGAASILRLAFS
jgi:hypothetical protein